MNVVLYLCYLRAPSISDQMLPQIVITVVTFGKLSLILVTFVQSFIEELLLGSEQIALFTL